ncbi:hypothetical protein D5085_00390 [Ectothiorhodospiraceae bacterium BW-2]|nr:hypothetical protein D5085_00390 [Ectothiorhodospiraceae bacterium BW-2]
MAKGLNFNMGGVANFAREATKEREKDKERLVNIPVNKIAIDPDQPRTLTFNLDDLREFVKNDESGRDEKWSNQQKEDMEQLILLSENIKKIGLKMPVLAYQEDDDSYRLISGERRLMAHRFNNAATIAATVCRKPDIEKEADSLGLEIDDKNSSILLELAIKDIQVSENLQRADLSFLDYFQLIKKYDSIYKALGKKFTGEIYSERVNFKRAYAYRYYRLLTKGSAELHDKIEQGVIATMTEAMAALNDELNRANKSSKNEGKISSISKHKNPFTLGANKQKQIKVAVKVIEKFKDELGIVLEDKNDIKCVQEAWALVLKKLTDDSEEI